MKAYIDERSMGAGKTYDAIERLITCKCKALFITERIESFDEVESTISKASIKHGVKPIVRRIHAGDLEWSNSVSREIEELPTFFRDADHVIVIATHAAMLRSDLSNFHGWQIVIDEVPQLLDFENLRTHLDADFFETHYQLAAFDEGWSSVTLTRAGESVTVADVQSDDSHRHLAVFHRRVVDASRSDARRVVVCNLSDWAMMADRNVKWCWASVFSFGELAAFDRVEMLGNRFRRDVGCEIAQVLDLDDIEWVTLPAPQPREFFHRHVHIHYFSDVRSSSLTFFTDPAGQKTLREIGEFLAMQMPAVGSIWSANAKARTSLAPRPAHGLATANYLNPRQAGTNLHKAASSAAMIYAAKPCPNLRALLKCLKIDTDKWAQSVEHETILQFATRTSVRDPGNASPVHIWVFDRKQALYLKRYFDDLAHVTAHMERVENGPVIPREGKRGPKETVRTPAEHAAHEVEKRARDAERKRLARARKRAASEALRAA